MKTLSLAEFQEQTRDSLVLSRDEHGDKVLLRPDGRIVKLFRRKRLLSSALFVPYATRFVRASAELKKRGIRAAVVEDHWRIPSLRRHAVVYPMLAGMSLRDRLEKHPERLEELLGNLARFLALLHQRGIYFRAIHLANVLSWKDEKDFALIDISETRFHRGSLSVIWRARNFGPLVKYAQDREVVIKFGPKRFVAEYLRACDLSKNDQDVMVNRFRSMGHLFAACS